MIDSLADKSYQEEQLRTTDKALGGHQARAASTAILIHLSEAQDVHGGWRKDVSTQPLQYLLSIFIFSTASLTNSSNQALVTSLV